MSPTGGRSPERALDRGRARPAQEYPIPPRLQEFHLMTGAPVLADFKSIPYRDVEVLEWYERLRLADEFYRGRIEDVECRLLDEARDAYGVTDAILPQGLFDLSCPALGETLYQDEQYAVVELRRR